MLCVEVSLGCRRSVSPSFLKQIGSIPPPPFSEFSLFKMFAKLNKCWNFRTE